ncbi:hypothetical protein [Roseimicrobium sp. ORNL1]|uniref:hypothetical protein n=1 Tax=Roseimicrobium sp. ORNL1 TaxID=2711231 RepID=UPI0013E1C078|nr:hypothetical protein [Roseimicrobium sp. ORNL1]QIF01777.1 hypothetical protein G5S37_09645 [Roseimicrobium sp. ORNL1]
MKTGWLIFIIAVLLAGAGFTARVLSGKSAGPCSSCATMAAPDTATSLAWIKKEFHLDDAEYQRVCALHDAYLPQCDAMCERIQKAGTRVSAALLEGGSRITPEVEAALRDYEILRAECQRNTLRHLTETAGVMKPEAGRAYMAKVLPHLLTTHQHVSEVTH